MAPHDYDPDLPMARPEQIAEAWGISVPLLRALAREGCPHHRYNSQTIRFRWGPTDAWLSEFFAERAQCRAEFGEPPRSRFAG